MDFPRLDSADLISVDCETKDTELETKGMGAVRDGFIAGVAVGTRTDAWYFPIAHEGGGNLPRENVLRWLSDTLSTTVPKVGANLQYDLAFLWTEGVKTAGPYYDVQIAEPLIDENQFSYSLETLGQRYTGRGKLEDEMLAYIRHAFGAKAGKEKNFIWRCPAHIVAPYAKEDVRLPIEILDKQLALIHEQGLEDIWDIECRLLPILARMHLNGIRVDVPYAEQLDIEWERRIAELEKEFVGINAGSSAQIAARLDAMGIAYPRHPPTEKMLERGITQGNPSLGSKVLATMADKVPFLKAIMEAKKYRHFLNTFIRGGILNSHICGRVHGTFNQLKGDDTGTVTGRLSCAHPNLLNIPNPEKDKFFSEKCRGMFLPDFGDWLRFDLSQMEYRLIVHFASTIPGSGADVAVRQYIENPATDFHLMCAELTGLPRKQAKNINFGIAFGMGSNKLCESLGVDKKEGKAILKTYDERVPFVRILSDTADQRATHRGFVTTIGGRRRRFNLWGPAKWSQIKVEPLADKEAAQALWGHVKRFGTHKAMNALSQGSNADWIKKAMVMGLEAGIYSVIGYPLNSVYDELCFSFCNDDPVQVEAAREMEHILRTAYPLNVPVLVGKGKGKSWGVASVAPDFEYGEVQTETAQ